MEKKQDVKAKKPEYWDTVYYIDYIGRIRKRTWINDEYALDMWELGNIFFTKKEAENYKRLEIWLEELKELREYKRKMKTQYLDDIENPLEPIKLSSALESEIFKYEYRAEHDPQKISPLDYTIIYALKHCLEEQLKEVE